MLCLIENHIVPLLFRNGRTQHAGPEMHALRPLDDLLVDRVRRMVHQHRPLPVIELAVHASVSDQVDDPFLAFVFIEAEAGGEIPVQGGEHAENS